MFIKALLMLAKVRNKKKEMEIIQVFNNEEIFKEVRACTFDVILYSY